MATNTLLTPTVITNELLMAFKNQLGFAKNATNEYDDRFNKIGDTLNLRVPVKFVANDGADITSQIQDVTEKSVPLVINKQKNAAFQFSAKDLSLTVDRFRERYLQQAAVALANQFEVDGLTMAVNNTPNYVGAAGTTPATAAVILQAGQKLDDNAAPMDGDRYLTVNPAAQAAVVGAFTTLFNSQSEVSAQYKKGRMGTALGFEWNMAQNIPAHTVGAWAGTVKVNGTTVTGATTLSIDGLTAASAALKAGDKFTISGVYEVNPITGVAGPNLRQFTVTADTTAATNAVAALPIYPAIISTGPYKTVSALPANDADIVVLGTPGTAYPYNIAYHKHAFSFAMAPLQMPQGVHFGHTSVDKDTGLSIRMVSAYNVLTDVYVTRCDILYGWAPRRPEWASIIIG